MTSTVVSWGLTLCLVGAAVYVYKPSLFNGLAAQGQEVKQTLTEPSKPPTKKPKPKKTASQKVVADEKGESASDSQSSKKRKISEPAAKTATATAGASLSKQQESPRDDKENLSDKDFARQLAQAQSGTKLQVPAKQQQPSKKDRRTSKLGQSTSPDPSGFTTEASSTNGRDADDDLTPAESPEARPFDKSISKAGDVSDMLEAPAAKPTTLRLTDVTNESKAKKPANKAFEQVLSKKKRNEKQRKEEARLAREESDRLHEAKKQEQMRKARIADGTSNQTKANNFTTKANAWQTGASTAVKSAPAVDDQPLLDTFDPASSTAATPHGAVHVASTSANSAGDLKARAGENKAAALTASASREGTSDMSEEDQMKILQGQQEEDAWESVMSKKTKRKGRQDNESASGASSPARPAAVPAKAQVVSNNKTTNGIPKKPETVNRFVSFQDKAGDGLQDAEWEA